MDVFSGIVLLVLGLFAWGGQTWSFLAPSSAQALKLSESMESVEPVFWADIRGEAAWDALTLWTLPVAGALLLFEQSQWAYFGLVGGGIYVYFAGRGIFTRIEMLRNDFRVGEASSVRLGLVMLAIWGVAGGLAIALAASDLT